MVFALKTRFETEAKLGQLGNGLLKLARDQAPKENRRAKRAERCLGREPQAALFL